MLLNSSVRPLWSILVLLVVARADSEISCLSRTGAVVSTPTASSWDTDRQVFNEKTKQQPVAIVYAKTPEQVQRIIECAQQSSLKVVPRGGGHSYEGYSVQAGKLVLDVSNLTTFQLDASNSVATFGAGYRLGPLFLKMYLDANSLFPAGLCPWVGASGHLLGGGTGLNTRSFGLACDQIVSLTMVDFKGDAVTANSTQNADLLWASCGGGGGNLGVVTSFSVQLHSLSVLPQVTSIQVVWSGYDHAAQIFDAVQKWAPFADRKLNLQFLLGFGVVSVNAQWQGPEAEARAEMLSSGLLSIPGITKNSFVQQTWLNATVSWAAGTAQIQGNSIFDLNMTAVPESSRKSFQAASSYNQELMSMEGVQVMVDAVSRDANVFVEHKILMGAVADRAPNETAFYWRDSLYETQWYYSWSDRNLQDAANRWLRNTLTAMKPYIGQGAYINYPDPLLAETSEWPWQYYGDNLEAYTRVKAKYDPGNFFNNPLTVKPKGTSLPGPIAAPLGTSAPGASRAAVVVGSGQVQVPNGPSISATQPALSLPSLVPAVSKVPING